MDAHLVEQFLVDDKTALKKETHFAKKQDERFPPVYAFETAIAGKHTGMSGMLYLIYIQENKETGCKEKFSATLTLEGKRIASVDLIWQTRHHIKPGFNCDIAPQTVTAHHVHYHQNGHDKCTLPLYYKNKESIETFIQSPQDALDYTNDAFHIKGLETLQLPSLDLPLWA